MAQQHGGGQDTGTDLAYLIVAGAALVIAARIWSNRVKPWTVEHVEAIRTSGVVTEVAGYSVTTVDLVAGAVIGVPVLLLLGIFRSARRRSRQAKADAT